jgi:hypothetical protein
MNCEYVHTWLMQVDSLLVKDWPRDMNRHFKACVACAKLARNLYKLEEAWRDLPLPEGCERAKADFLKKISKPTKTQKSPQSEESGKPEKVKPMGRPWHPVRWVAVAAMLFIGISAFSWMLFMPSQSNAAPSDIVDRLIDWNLDMTLADADERKSLLEKHEAQLRKDLKKDETRLSLEERKMAEELLEAGVKLASNEDVLAEAEIITSIADKLADRASTAEASGNDKDKERCASHYDRFRQFGVVPVKMGQTPLFIKFAQMKPPEPKTATGMDKSKFEKAILLHKQQMEKMEKIWDNLPERRRPDMHKRVEGFNKKGPGMPRFGGKK